MRNLGGIPGMAKGKRVRVILVNGQSSDNYQPPHWPADTLDWSIHPEGHRLRPFDIEQFEVIA